MIVQAVFVCSKSGERQREKQPGIFIVLQHHF